MVVFLDIATFIFKVNTYGTRGAMMCAAKVNKKFFSSKYLRDIFSKPFSYIFSSKKLFLSFAFSFGLLYFCMIT